MTSALLTRSPTLFDALGAPEAHGNAVGGEPTLDDFVTGIWEGLAARRPVSCPLCDGPLAPVYAAHSRPPAATPKASSVRPAVLTGGRCQECGTTLG